MASRVGKKTSMIELDDVLGVVINSLIGDDGLYVLMYTVGKDDPIKSISTISPEALVQVFRELATEIQASMN